MNKGTSYLRYLNREKLKQLKEPVIICGERPLAVLVPYEQYIQCKHIINNCEREIRKFFPCQAQLT